MDYAVEVTTLRSTQDVVDLARRKPDLVFSRLKRFRGQDEDESGKANRQWFPDQLAEYGINHTGSQGQAFNLEYSKQNAKREIASNGIETADYFVTKPGEHTELNRMPVPFPLFLKPTSLGSSRGIADDSVVRDMSSFTSKVESLASLFGAETIAEAYVSGREFSVAVVQDIETQALKALPVEIIVEANNTGDRVLSSAVKSADSESVVAVADGPLRDLVMELAVRSFTVLGGRDYGRIDMRLNGNSRPSFIEANFLPGLGHHGYFARACELNLKLSYSETIQLIAEIGLTRSALKPVLH